MNGRLRFIDVYRGLAILLMLHGHTADAVLSPSEKMSIAFQIYTIFRGFTAPMFLFISGFAFSITTLKYAEEYFKFSKKFIKRLRKFFFITLLGYFLHLPYLSLKKILNETDSQTLAQLFSSDVLQVIGLTLLFLQIALFLIKDEAKFANLMLYLGASIFALSQIFFTIDFSKFLPLPISQYLNTFNGSKFPFFPWSGFVMFGSYLGYIYIKASKNGTVEKFFKEMSIASLALFPIAIALQIIYEATLKPDINLIYSSPFLAISRLAFVMTLFCAIWKIDAKMKLKVHPLQFLGMESLFAYVFHLMVVYGSPVNPFHSYYALIGNSLEYPFAFLLFILLAIATFVLSYFLNHLKLKKPQTINFLKFAIANLFLLIFIANPH
jgi:uncharacterized membrane protein